MAIGDRRSPCITARMMQSCDRGEGQQWCAGVFCIFDLQTLLLLIRGLEAWGPGVRPWHRWMVVNAGVDRPGGG